MADNSNNDWQDAPSGAVPLNMAFQLQDQYLQSRHPNWPTGGTAQQLKEESGANYDMNAVSPKGAQGMVQAMPDTKAAVEKQIGRKLDFNNVNDQLLFHRYLMDQNLQRSGGDVNNALSLYNSGKMNATNPETSNYVAKFNEATKPGTINNSAGWEDVPKVAQAGSDWTDVPKDEKPDSGILANLKGFGLQAANWIGGGLEALPIAAHAAYEGITKGNDLQSALSTIVQTGTEDFNKYSPEAILNKVGGVDTSGLHGTLGYQLPAQAIDLVFNKVPEVLGEGLARTGQLEAGMSPSEYTPEAGQKAKEALQAGMILSPLAGIPGAITSRFKAREGAAPSEAELAAQKLQTSSGETPTSFSDIFSEADRASDAIRARNIAQHEVDLQPTVEENLAKLREQATGEQQGIIEDAQAAADRESGQLNLFRDNTARNVADFNDMVQRGHQFTQADLFNDLPERRFDQYGPEEQPRALSKDEFNSTMENLANQSGTLFDMPLDRDTAYDRYLDSVSDTQGGLFDRPTIAKNFAEQLNDAALQEKVNAHPAVKAAAAQVSHLQNELDFINSTGVGNKGATEAKLAEATSTWEKAKTNISKFFKDTIPQIKADGDSGVINMHSGIKPPDWLLHGVGNMLKAFHGVVFKQLSKLVRKPDNLDSFGKIVQSGIADRINQEANRNWEVSKNGNAVDHIQENSPLGKFDAIKEWIPDDRPYDQAKQDFVNAPDMDSSWLTKNVGSQGGLWAGAISKSPIVKWAYTKVNEAQKSIDYQVKQLLTDKKTGLQAKMRNLTASEKGEIYAFMDMNEGKKTFTDGELKRQGFNDKQIDYYRTHQDTMKKILDQVNTSRANIGLPEIDPRIAYMSSRFMGDFRSLVYQKGTGHIVGFLGHNNRWALRQLIKHVDEQNPGKYEFEKPTLNKADMSHPQNMFQGYMNVLDMLSKTDADVKAIVDSYRSYLTNDAAKMLGALKHAKDKEGIFGAEGKKAWESQKKNADEGMKSQLKYAENMIKWSNMQDAASQVKQILSDSDINKPNAKAYVKDYLNNALGHTQTGLSRVMNEIMNGVSNATGVGPSIWRGMNNMQKSALLQMWLGFMRIPHSMLTLTQFFQSNPAFARMVKARGIDDASFWGSSLKGASTSLKIMREALTGKQVEGMSPFERAISDYNKKNAVFAVNLKSHLEDINSSKFHRNWDAITEANITYPEAALRALTFSMWSHALKDAGMSDKEALGTAENFTRGALVDYRPIERPLMYGKMGFLGDIASTLTRFKMNQLSQHIYFGKNALKQGDITPLATLLAGSIAFAGASGVLGFAQANELYHLFSKYVLGKPDTLKGVFLRNLPDWANYGVFSQLGINMQGSYSNADVVPENPFAAMFPTGSTLLDMGQSLFELARYHDVATAKKVAYNFSPTSVKGFEENYLMSDKLANGDRAFHRPGTGELQSIRTPTEQMQRNFAFHPFIEARNYDVANEARLKSEDYADLRKIDLKRLTDIYQNRMPTQDEVQSFRSDWVQHRGDASAANDIIQKLLTMHTTQMQRARGLNPTSLESLYKVQDINAMKGTNK